jgi:urease accessory protein
MHSIPSAALFRVDIPGVELLISGSVLLFGALLVIKRGMGALTVLSLAAIAGLFHGYAYGEAIFGAETQPLLAYLVGFTLIQLLIAVSAFGIGKIVQSADEPFGTKLRPVGLVLCGIGIAFLFSQVMDLLVPLSNG